MSEHDYRQERERKAREKWQSERLTRLRSSLVMHVGKTVWLDLSDSSNQLAPRVLGQLAAVSGNAIEVIDMSDASLPPSEKPRVTIALASIRDWRAT